MYCQASKSPLIGDMVNSAACSAKYKKPRYFSFCQNCCQRQDMIDRRAGKTSAGSSSRNISTSIIQSTFAVPKDLSNIDS